MREIHLWGVLHPILMRILHNLQMVFLGVLVSQRRLRARANQRGDLPMRMYPMGLMGGNLRVMGMPI